MENTFRSYSSNKNILQEMKWSVLTFLSKTKSRMNLCQIYFYVFPLFESSLKLLRSISKDFIIVTKTFSSAVKTTAV